MSIRDLSIGQKVSFEIYPVHIFGNNFTNVTITAFMDYEMANALGLDIISAHNMVYPNLPNGSVNDPTLYSYVRVTFDNGKSQILGVPWIREDTVLISDGKKLTLTFQDLDERRRDRILASIRAINENPETIKFE